MSKKEVTLRNLINQIDSIFEKMERRDMDYNPVETDFEMVMKNEVSPESILNFLNPSIFIKEVEFAIGELRNDKKAQESYLLYTYNSLVTSVHTWCYNFSHPGNYAADLMINEMEKFQKTVSFALSKQEEVDEKKEGVYIKPVEPSSDIFDLIMLYEKDIDSNFEAMKEAMEPYLAISELIRKKIISIKENLDYKSEYRATQLYIEINEFEKELQEKKNSYIQMFFSFWRKPTPNEIQLMNSFWEIVEKLDETNVFPKLKSELAPENVIRNFLDDKIHFNTEEKENTNDMFSIFQKIMIVKKMKLDSFMLHEQGFTQAQMCKLFAALIGCNYKVLENYFGEYEARIKDDKIQINKDKEAVKEFFRKTKISTLIKTD